MVKLSKKKDILSQLAQPIEEEDFFLESNTYLENEALNEEEEHFNERLYDDKNEEMIEKLRTIDGKKRRNLRTEIVKGEFDVNISKSAYHAFLWGIFMEIKQRVPSFTLVILVSLLLIKTNRKKTSFVKRSKVWGLIKNKQIRAKSKKNLF